jgi:hypothetical protein
VVPSITFTDGAKYVADAAGAYWLLDEIALAQRHVKAVAAEEFSGLETQSQCRRHRHPRLRGRQRQRRFH